MSKSHYYDGKRYDPAAPVFPVSVMGLEDEPRIEQVIALIDTGADTTILPLSLIRRIGGVEIEKVSIRGIHGATIQVSLYGVLLRIAGHDLGYTEVVGAHFPTEPIIGRDVLQHLIVTLDGTAGETVIST